MKKRLYFCFIIFTLIFFISSVTKTVVRRNEKIDVMSTKTSYEDVTKMLLNLKTYALSGTVTYISNEGESTYNMLQYGKKDGTYRIELIDEDDTKITTIYDGRAIFQFNDAMKGVVNISTDENSEKSEIFITKFIKNYENSKDVSVLVSTLDNSVCTVLEAIVPGNNRYFSSEKLYVSNETNLPVKLVIYDEDDIARIVLSYDQFVINPTLDEEIFSVRPK